MDDKPTGHLFQHVQRQTRLGSPDSPRQAEYDVVRGPKGFQAANVTGPGGQQVMGDNRGRNK